ncbi:MAG: PRC-barrel domain-containing protein [Candidatus Methanoplasma sp.]|jgi:sporulation protein YlmC with PRC-barrel domain|nr:PRC-barrel domain-containing protein [Candidatus Methanoplasma sp.]
MGDRMFLRELIGLEVETISGRRVGTLEDLVVDTDGGAIRYLLVSASGSVLGSAHRVDERGRIVVETDRIRVEGSKIVIN